MALRDALVRGRTHAHLNWSWTLGRLPGHIALKCGDFVRFVRGPRLAHVPV
jgi:hypothetical protein